MSYRVKELFFTLQGEGRQAGRPAVFCRFAGCNLWTGRPEHRDTAVCRFCDTDFVGTDGPGGGRFADAASLARAVGRAWPVASAPASTSGRAGGGTHDAAGGDRFVVLTGGEPLLQVDADLVRALHAEEFEVAVETNGTVPPPPGIDWVCVSPKAGAELVVTSGSELKLVFPQPGAEPARFEDLDFDNFLLQPMDGPDLPANTAAAVEFCLAHPRWSLSLQTHKLLGIP